MFQCIWNACMPFQLQSITHANIYTCIYSHENLITQSCYVISHFHTSKISSLGLMIKQEQFHLNHLTKHIFSQNLFCDHCFRNSKTLGYCSYQSTNFGSFGEPVFLGRSRPHTHHNTTHGINHAISHPNSP